MENSHADLFEQYLEVCNRALEASKNKFPFKQIFSAARAARGGHIIEVCVIDDGTQFACAISVEDEKLKSYVGPACDHCECEGQWRIKRSYLEGVIRHQDEYIQNPAKIDWGWLQLSIPID